MNAYDKLNAFFYDKLETDPENYDVYQEMLRVLATMQNNIHKLEEHIAKHYNPTDKNLTDEIRQCNGRIQFAKQANDKAALERELNLKERLLYRFEQALIEREAK